MAGTSYFPSELRRPVQVAPQLSLFPYNRDEYMARARVSLDDMARWREMGWISFDAAILETLEDNEFAEMVFVRDVAQSGLSDAFITELLSQLPKPYSYPPVTTVYHFNWGWVQVSFPDMDEMMTDRLDAWIEDKLGSGDLERLEDVQARVMIAVARLRASRKNKQTE